MIGRFASASLKAKILSMMVGVSVLIGAVTTVLFELAMRENERTKLEGFKAHAMALQESIAAQFYERYGDVQAFAENRVLHEDDRDAIAHTLDRYIALYGIYDLILFVDTKGRLIASSGLGPDGKPIAVDGLRDKDFGGEDWYRAVVSERFTEDRAKGLTGTVFSPPMIDAYSTAAYGKPTYGTAFSAPVKNTKGELIGVLSCRAGMRWLDATMVSLYEGLHALGLPGAEMSVLDGRGVVVAEYDPSARGGDRKVVHDLENTLLKLNLVEKGVSAAEAAVKRRVGSEWSHHARKNISQAAGFAPVTGQKFIDSVGWVTLVRAERDGLVADLTRSRRIFYTAMAVFAVLVPLLAYWFSSRLARVIGGVTERVQKESISVSASATQIAASSTELSEAATEQASALQETVAAVDEINAMVTKNAETARRTADMATASEQVVTRGKQTVTGMVDSIGEIATANTEIMQQMEASNREISEIVKVIAEIGNKTKVINDIVFQTKLLSFNASVEAARAGEHGKGFAVVAEEVGNLAQMSGSAAKEISSMLESSIDKVERIVSSTRTKVDALVKIGKEKVDTGTRTAGECDKALEDIRRNVSQMSQMVVEIASASQEQAQGIKEVNKALNQLDQVTQQNTAVAQQSSTTAEDLSQRADTLKAVVGELEAVVSGRAGDGGPTPSRSATTVRPERAQGSGRGTGGAEQVVTLDSRRKAPPAPRQGLKLAAGSDLRVPDADDPRFTDV